jgi:hypothetical protein
LIAAQIHGRAVSEFDHDITAVCSDDYLVRKDLVPCLEQALGTVGRNRLYHTCHKFNDAKLCHFSTFYQGILLIFVNPHALELAHEIIVSQTLQAEYCTLVLNRDDLFSILDVVCRFRNGHLFIQ